MLQWIQENQEWVFSGMGVFIIGGILGGVWRFLAPRFSSHSSIADGSTNVEYASLTDDENTLLTAIADSKNGGMYVSLIAETTGLHKVRVLVAAQRLDREGLLKEQDGRSITQGSGLVLTQKGREYLVRKCLV